MKTNNILQILYILYVLYTLYIVYNTHIFKSKPYIFNIYIYIQYSIKYVI